MSDYYELLGVSKTSSKEEISKAYKKQAFKWHPDRNQDNIEKATEMFQKIGKAYEVLSDDDKKSIYDRFGEEGLTSGINQMPNPFEQGFNPFNLFGGMFGGMPGEPNRQQGNTTITHTIKCSLKETYTGHKKHEHIQRQIFCTTCDNTGFKDKRNHSCTSCNGKGIQVLVHQIGPGMIQQSTRTCISCKGTGGDSNYPKCEKCNGNKKINETIRIEVDIRKGTKHGQQFIIKNKGNQISETNFSDIIIVFEVIEDSVYTRVKNDLHRKLNISLRKALLGFEMVLEHIDGKNIVIKSSEIIHPHSTKVLPKLGFLSDSGNYGNYYIQFNVVFPSRFSSKQLKALDLVLHKDADAENEQISVSKIDNLHHYRLENTTTNIDDMTDEPQEPQNIQCAQQ